ncbi:ABC transporter type 1, transmembrane domain-containing protein [Zopfochytrium polystomum]|nr:ABC transporter type 1, transmembrane domain-containing protein [Zopfochytrium polystomum]
MKVFSVAPALPPLETHAPLPKPRGGGTTRAETDAADVDGGDAGADAAGSFFENLTLQIPRGKLTCVMTPVAAAAAAAWAESSPPVEIRGWVAYAPQQPRTVTDTVQGSIAFAGGRPELAGLGQAERERMDAAIEAAMLKADLAAMSAGRKTLIGEKGARAVYDNADIYLLDDPMSALDARLHFLPFADHIVVMQKGRIVEEGKFEALVAKPDGALSEMMAGYFVHGGKDKVSGASQSGLLGKEVALAGGTHDGEDAEKEIGEEGDDGDEEASGSVGQDGNIAKEEERETGTISKKVWLSFFRAVGGWPLVATILTASVLNQAVGAATILGLSAISRLMYAPMSFFESQNRLSRDVDFIDQYLYLFFFSTMFYVLQLIAPLILLVIYFPILLAIIVPIMGVYYIIGLFYRTTKRELRHLESIYRSPLNAHISETLAGIPTIRDQAEDRFVARQRVLTDLSNSLRFSTSARPFGISGKVSPSSIGLTLTYALSIIDIVGGLVQNYAMLESEMNSVERLEYYCTEIPNEAARALPTDPDQS